MRLPSGQYFSTRQKTAKQVYGMWSKSLCFQSFALWHAHCSTIGMKTICSLADFFGGWVEMAFSLTMLALVGFVALLPVIAIIWDWR